MNFITAHDVYCFYPRLTADNKAVYGFRKMFPLSDITLESRGFQVFPDMRGFNRACGNYCPVKYRRVRGGRGIGVVRWKEPGIADYGVDYTEADSSATYVWKLGASCLNPKCPLNDLE